MRSWRWDRWAAAAAIACSGAAAACGSTTSTGERSVQPVATVAPEVGASAGAAGDPAPALDGGADLPVEPLSVVTDSPLEREIRQMLARIATARQLPVKQPVTGRRLSRAQVIKLIEAKAERDIPKAALEAQGDLLRAFELIAPSYDFVGGIYELIENNVAGLYDDDTNEMVLLDDLDAFVAEQTLAHELVHALQDQHYDLDKLLKYQAGQSDRVTAQHALAEGDATSAMLEATEGSAFLMTTDALRFMMVASVALSPTGAQTPRVLQAALVAPYLDGFSFVQELRRRGGWAEVDRAWRRLPTSTEQLLHVDKYVQAEPPIVVPPPPLPATGWRTYDADVLGEQGLRLVLEQWTHRKSAAAAAAGWGGDTYLVAHRATGTGTEIAVAWHIRFDTSRDAREAAEVFRKRFGAGCRARKLLGSLAWMRRGDGIAMVAGPYQRGPQGQLSELPTSCGSAVRWLAKVLKTR
ncbi:MAG: hypothetical protein DRI90_18560 [Deltaproteobacteria bacterium]|nr:MAG: hypothetical protein DRI90_18560 [Deltaproteobacteria bacterium]